MSRYLPVILTLLLFAISLQTYLTRGAEGGWRNTALLIGLIIFGIMTLVGLYTLFIRRTEENSREGLEGSGPFFI